jgi:hypothetical protein
MFLVWSKNSRNGVTATLFPGEGNGKDFGGCGELPLGHISELAFHQAGGRCRHIQHNHK